jgi:methylphosphotriester-DNA--protein-cysteine methyltransferase
MKPCPRAISSGRVLFPGPCHAYVCVSSTVPLPRRRNKSFFSNSNLASKSLFCTRCTLLSSCVARDTTGVLPSPRGLSKNALSTTL